MGRAAAPDKAKLSVGAGKTVHVRIGPGLVGNLFMEIENGDRPRLRFLG
jgi:hypothetical protein